MKCDAAIQMANTSVQTVSANSDINLGTAQHRINRNAINGNANGINILEPGYYLVIATVTFTAATTGVVSAALTVNGSQLAGATAAESVNTATTEVHTMTINRLILVPCGAAPVVLDVEMTGIEANPSNISYTVIRIKG